MSTLPKVLRKVRPLCQGCFIMLRVRQEAPPRPLPVGKAPCGSLRNPHPRKFEALAPHQASCWEHRPLSSSTSPISVNTPAALTQGDRHNAGRQWREENRAADTVRPASVAKAHSPNTRYVQHTALPVTVYRPPTPTAPKGRDAGHSG